MDKVPVSIKYMDDASGLLSVLEFYDLSGNSTLSIYRICPFDMDVTNEKLKLPGSNSTSDL